ncbi:LOW QUALITY PROTEIN: eukaryotic translation initiation factor 4 gamma 1 [Oncorhynchus tshawytscha]|uniref:LOW QUALITY PROTEIN: eukaryotic translation initiation factor 4 gamma 1 n=1 Tax=Oncorhynchus tshawytscha TaxID=74940 RepID=UPI001C3DF674|nr:LOW QUALITY PROTEIN: eukaryotic translation initiation factor 4 gamma 1 [Oncorhynchus tshawytscha]
MNKAPQPITGPPSATHPAPSPGIQQATFPPGQPPSVVFATPPPQMNPAPQHRQFAPGPRALHQQGGFRSLQPYYSRPSLPSNAPRVPPSSTPRPVAPTHVYQPGQQMMMIPSQQIPFPNQQGPAYFIPGQYRSTYVATPQQYPVPPGTPGFYPGTSPAEYGTYAGAYYPAQQQYTSSVPAAPVIMNPPPQQQQPPPQQQIHPKRERKQIIIRDPNQGGRDITEEIMSGGTRSGTTPTPPQVSDDSSESSISGSEGPAVGQADGENVTPVVVRPDDRGNPAATLITVPPALSKTPELVKTYPAPTEVKLPDTNSKSPSLSQDLPTPPSVTTTHHTTVPTTPQPSTSPIADMMDAPAAAPAPSAPEVPAYPAPLPEPRPTPAAEEHPSAAKEEREEVKIKEEVAEARLEVTTSSKPEPSLAPVITPSSSTNGISATQPPPAKEEEPAALIINMPTPRQQNPRSLPSPSQRSSGCPMACRSPAPRTLRRCLRSRRSVTSAPLLSLRWLSYRARHLPKLTPVAVTATPAPIVKATPTPVAQATPAPIAQAPPVLAETATTTVVTAPRVEDEMDSPPPQSTTPAGESSMQAAVSVPKKKRKMKDLNKKEAVGDLLDAFKEEQVVESTPEPEQATPTSASDAKEPRPANTPAVEEVDETWEEKEDKLDAENIEPKPEDLKYQYKEELCRPIDPEEKKRYDRDFLLGFQFISAAMSKPEGLPQISDVVLDKANKAPLRQLDPSRLPGMNMGPDFTPSFANLGRPGMGGGGGGHRGGPPSGMGGGGPRRSQQGQRKEPRRIINISSSLTEDVKLNKAEKAWKPAVKKATSGQAAPEEESDDSEQAKTQELFKRVRSILNKLTPQMFQQLMKQVTELTIDTEERLKGVIDLIFEKAISEPNFSVAYANMCRCLIGLKVPTTDKPGVTVNFRKLLLNRCQKEFEKDKDDDVIFEKKQKELDAAAMEEKDRLKAELEEAKDKARRRSLGNIKFIGELFKLKMLTEAIMHDCIVKLLKNHDEESLECLCRLLSTIGKDLDFEKAKPRMDQYFAQMDKIIKEKKTSSRIRFMLQDVLDLRRNTWVPRRGEQGPKTIDQIHKDAELEEHREVLKVQQQLLNQNTRGGVGGRGGGGRDQGSRGGQHPQTGQRSQPQDEGWNTVPISTKSRPIDTSRLSKITKPGALDFNNQLLAPQLGGKGMWGSWGKGSSGGTTGAKPAGEATPESGGRPATSTLNRFSALQPQQPSSSGPSHDSDRRVPQRNSSSRDRGSDRFERHDRGSNDRFDRRDDRRDDRDRNRPPVTKRSFSRETEEHSREREHRGPADPVRRVASMTDDRSSRDRARSKDNVKREAALTPPPAQNKPALSEEMLEKKSTAIIEEYLHINDMKEALQCVVEMNSTPLLFVFVRSGLESTLERSPIVRERMGLLLHQLYKAGTLPKEQYYRGLQEILEVAEDMAIDVPHIWLYLAELITPMLHEGGIPMGQLFKEISKPLVPQGTAGVLLVQILTLLCKGMSHKKAGAMWREAGLSWKDFLPEDEDVNKFVTEKNVEFTLGGGGGGDDETEKSRKKELSSEELNKQLDRLIQDKADNQRIYDWVEANLDETQMSSNMFVRAVMTSICQSAIICENPYKLDAKVITRRAKLLHKYLKDEQKELQALYALQALMVEMEQPANLLRMFFDTLYDEDVIKEEAFNKWESSKDPAEMQGKGVALKSVTAFFTWLREAEDEESDNNS